MLHSAIPLLDARPLLLPAARYDDGASETKQHKQQEQTQHTNRRPFGSSFKSIIAISRADVADGVKIAFLVLNFFSKSFSHSFVKKPGPSNLLF